jgi:hypothetical protein
VEERWYGWGRHTGIDVVGTKGQHGTTHPSTHLTARPRSHSVCAISRLLLLHLLQAGLRHCTRQQVCREGRRRELPVHINLGMLH